MLWLNFTFPPSHPGHCRHPPLAMKPGVITEFAHASCSMDTRIKHPLCVSTLPKVHVALFPRTWRSTQDPSRIIPLGMQRWGESQWGVPPQGGRVAEGMDPTAPALLGCSAWHCPVLHHAAAGLPWMSILLALVQTNHENVPAAEAPRRVLPSVLCCMGGAGKCNIQPAIGVQEGAPVAHRPRSWQSSSLEWSNRGAPCRLTKQAPPYPVDGGPSKTA